MACSRGLRDDIHSEFFPEDKQGQNRHQEQIIMKPCVSVYFFAGLCLAHASMAAEYYVNPTGNDAWSGALRQPNAERTDGPFKTLERAQLAIRHLKQSGRFDDKITVNIAAGRYRLARPLHYNLVDSGLPGREIVWQGEAGGQVMVSGGMPLICTKREARFWVCPLTEPPVSRALFESGRIKGDAPRFELFINDQKLQLARWPDQGWAHIKLPVDENTQFSTMEVLPVLAGDIKAAQVHIFAGNDWYDQYLGVDAIDRTANRIKLSAPTNYKLESGRRFYIQNLPALLNAPGEWSYDREANIVTFIPPEGMVPQSVTVSSLPNILVADGVKNVTFKNIRFQHSTGTAITIKNGHDLVMEQLEVNNIGGIGIEIKNGQNVELRNSEIHHTGAHGVIVAGGDRKPLQTSGHVIYNNHIHHMGTTILTYSAGVEINGVGVTVSHNLLEQGAGTAILLTGNEHLLEKNELHHFCLQASDCGAIYSGRDWSWRGNIIRNNYIHDIIGYGMKSVDVAKNRVVYQSPEGARGVYLDDGASGFDVNGNIFENAGFMALQVGGGRDNKIINNYFNTSEYAIFLDDRRPGDQIQKSLAASPYKTELWQKKYPDLAAPMHNKSWPEGNRIERNIIVTTRPGGNSLRYLVPMASTVIANNLIWSASGQPAIDYKVLELDKKWGGASWPQWMAEGVEQGSRVADPCVTITNKKMTVCPGSPVNEIGFVPLPVDMGLIQ